MQGDSLEANEFAADYEPPFDDMQPSEEMDAFEEENAVEQREESPFVGRHPSPPGRSGQPMRLPATPTPSNTRLFPATPRPKAVALVGSRPGSAEAGQPQEAAAARKRPQVEASGLTPPTHTHTCSFPKENNAAAI